MTLTTALALLGGAVLLALALHGLWKMRRAAARKPSVPLGASDRFEPTFLPDEDGGGSSKRPADAGDTLPEAPPLPSFASRPLPWRGVRLDPLIDAIVPIALQAPVSGKTNE